MLIDKHDVLNEIGELFTICSETLPNENGKKYVTEEELVEFYHSIMAIPIIDAVPVVHGKWIRGDKLAWQLEHYICSICSEISWGKKRNYCPNCGAKMDKGEINE